MIEIIRVKRLKLDPATGEPTIEWENQTRRKSGEIQRRAEHLASLAKNNYLGSRRPAEDYIGEATKQIIR